MWCLAIDQLFRRERHGDKEEAVKKQNKEKKEMKDSQDQHLSLESLPRQDRFENICSWLQQSSSDDDELLEHEDNVVDSVTSEDNDSEVSDEDFKHIFTIKRRSLRGMHPIKIHEDMFGGNSSCDQQLKVTGISTC